MSKLKARSLIYCIKGNWENGLDFRRLLDRIYMTSILYVQYFQISLYDNDDKVTYCTVVMKTNTQFSRASHPAAYKITTGDTQPQKDMTTVKIVDTFDLMMIVRWVTNISYQSPKIELACQTHTHLHVLNINAQISVSSKIISFYIRHCIC